MAQYKLSASLLCKLCPLPDSMLPLVLIVTQVQRQTFTARHSGQGLAGEERLRRKGAGGW